VNQSSFVAATVEDLQPIAAHLLELSSRTPLLLFNGEMGSGKTTLIKTICQLAGVTERVSSPTFSLVNTYVGDNDLRIHHFDLHRIEVMEELLDFGFEDYIDTGDLCLIEWPKIAGPLLPSEVVLVSITEVDGRREVAVRSVA